MVNFRQILEYLSGSVQICTDSHRNFFQTSIERRVYLVQHFLINKYLNFKLYLRIAKFRQILEYLSGSVQIRRECLTWYVIAIAIGKKY